MPIGTTAVAAPPPVTEPVTASTATSTQADSFALPPATSAPHIDFTADHFDYQESSSLVHLKGRVTVKESTLTIHSDEVWMNAEERHGWSDGYIEIDNGVSRLSGDSGDFYFNERPGTPGAGGRTGAANGAKESGATGNGSADNRLSGGAATSVGATGAGGGGAGTETVSASTGSLRNASAGFPPWRIRGTTVREDARGDIYFRHAWFTSCNLDLRSHYHFRSSYAHVRPKKWLLSLNNVMFLHNVPVFYLPFLYKPIDPFLRTKFNFGIDQRNGKFLKTTTFYNPTRYVSGKLFLDGFDREGYGYGNELAYSQPGIGNGALYGYRISERRNHQIISGFPTDLSRTQRWGLAGDALQNLNSMYQVQMRLQAQSDANFYNNYGHSSPLPINPLLINTGALVRHTNLTTTSLSFTRQDTADLFTQRYTRTSEDAPRLDFRIAPLSLGTPLLHTFNAFAVNTYTNGNPFLQKSVGAGWNVTKGFPITRLVSFTPNASFTETYQNKFTDFMVANSTKGFIDPYIARYSLAGNLRVATPLGNWDLAQTYARRMVPNTLAPDVLANDRGVEANLVTLQDFFRPTRLVFLRLQSGYDWRTYLDHTVGFRDRVQPFVGEVNVTPLPLLNISAYDSYLLNGGDQAISVQMDYGVRTTQGNTRQGDHFIGVGLGHNTALVQHYIFNEDFAWGPASATWKVGGVLRQDAQSSGGSRRLSRTAFFDKELWIAKDWHDFSTSFQARARPGGIKEFQVRIQLRFDNERPLPTGDEPWRLWQSQGTGER